MLTSMPTFYLFTPTTPPLVLPMPQATSTTVSPFVFAPTLAALMTSQDPIASLVLFDEKYEELNYDNDLVIICIERY